VFQVYIPATECSLAHGLPCCPHKQMVILSNSAPTILFCYSLQL